jgi:aspartyl-tRNA(Asn)/glutamyl-tRNA(Gln) amidotransferase subunit A
MTGLCELSAGEVSAKVRSGELQAVEYISAIFSRLKEVEGEIHAFVTTLESQALDRAREIDAKVRQREALGSLAGVAIALKDNLCIDGVRTTCSSRILHNFISPYDATVVERLRHEDAIFVGKTNMDEFAMGTSTENSCFGPTSNPLDPKYVPGGSSGGSAAAVASKEVPLALGSDTGGSVRCPASFCGVIGLKPTYGLVSRYGLIAYANSLEQIGPIAGNAYDCALILSAISGHDPRDSTSAPSPPKDYTKNIEKPTKGLRLGLPKEFFGEGIDGRVEGKVREGLSRLEEGGARIVEISLPSLKYALAAYYIIAMSEASSNLARYDGLRYGYNRLQKEDNWSTFFSRNRGEGFGPEVKRRIILGTYALSAGYYDRYYLKALQVRTLIRRDFERAFRLCDVIAGPTMPVLPFKLGERIDDPMALYMCDILTVPANLVGCPAISLRCGNVDGLPVGIQAMARFFNEDILLRLGKTLEGFKGGPFT